MAQGVQFDDLFKLKTTNQLEAFGNEVFFVENSVSKEDNGYRTNLKSVDLSGNIYSWGTSNKNNLSPKVVGANLYFTSQTGDDKSQLYKMPLSGGAAVKITDFTGEVNQVVSSQNKRYLVFQTMETNEKPKLPSPEKTPTVRYVNRLQSKADGYGWLPNDVVYTTWSFNPQTGESDKLFSDNYGVDLMDVANDGSQLLYVREQDPNDDNNLSEDVYLYSLETKNETALTGYNTGNFFDAKFSPDTKTVALVGNDDKFVNNTVSDLFLFDTASGNLSNMTEKFEGDVFTLLTADLEMSSSGKIVEWIDDNTYLFSAAYHGHSQLYLGNSSGVKLLTDNSEYVYDFSVLDNKTALVSISMQTLPNSIVKLDLASGKSTVLYNPNAEYEKDHEYSKPEKFSYQADDGQELEGWYLAPLNPQRKNPVLLYVHGGPHAAYGEGFFHEFQAHAAKGYGVVFVNPRGSTGYGQEFEHYVVGHYGEKDFTDVMSGLDYALSKYPELDESRQYIAGGSYGGFMTTWAVGHTNRFTAAVASRSVTDWVSMWGTSDIGYHFNVSELGLDLFDEGGYEEYWRRSPMAYVNNVKTPIRMLHGEWDMRCPVTQSEEFYTGLAKNGVDADFIRYPQSFHGVSRNGLPNLRIKRLADINDWFENHQ